MSIIRIDATKNATQISFCTGQLSLSEKKTTLPLSPPDTHAAHQLRLMVFNTRATCYLIARYCLGLEQKSLVTEANPFSSVVRS